MSPGVLRTSRRASRWPPRTSRPALTNSIQKPFGGCLDAADLEWPNQKCRFTRLVTFTVKGKVEKVVCASLSPHPEPFRFRWKFWDDTIEATGGRQDPI